MEKEKALYLSASNIFLQVYLYGFQLFFSSGSIGARLSTDALNVKRLVGDNLALNFQTLSTIISGFTIAMVANWKLTLIITVVVPLVGFQAYAQMMFLKGFNKNAKVHALKLIMNILHTGAPTHGELFCLIFWCNAVNV